VAPKSKQNHPGFFKTLSLRLGVFFACSFCLPAVQANCTAEHALHWFNLEAVTDGDSLRLSDGSKVRVVGINAPELARKDQPAEPLALKAKQAASMFLSETGRVGLLFGTQRKDRYGRLLADVYRADGQSLSQHLISEGLAIQVVIPPNTQNWQCLSRVQSQAKEQNKGLWQHDYFTPRHANQLKAVDAGFRRVSGVVENVSVTKNGWWLEIGQLAVRIAPKHLQYFEKKQLRKLSGRKIEVRGWVVNRADSPLVKQYGYKPFLINLGHPAMMVLTP
jgi:endonuclease YncB( thermonuclease family)